MTRSLKLLALSLGLFFAQGELFAPSINLGGDNEPKNLTLDESRNVTVDVKDFYPNVSRMSLKLLSRPSYGGLKHHCLVDSTDGTCCLHLDFSKNDRREDCFPMILSGITVLSGTVKVFCLDCTSAVSKEQSRSGKNLSQHLHHRLQTS